MREYFDQYAILLDTFAEADTQPELKSCERFANILLSSLDQEYDLLRLCRDQTTHLRKLISEAIDNREKQEKTIKS